VYTSEIDMAFTRDDLEKYEKGPQKQVDDKLSPFRGATPARAADAAAIAAVQAGQIDATPGGAPAAAVATTDPLVDDSPVVDEDGTLGDPTDSGEGTSDVQTEESSASAVDPGDETDPNTDLTGGETTEEEVVAQPAPKKGSAAERIVEVLDLAEGYKVFGKTMQEQLLAANAELARLRAFGGTTTAAVVAPPVVDKDEPMPDMADADVAYDNDKYREKMAKWVKTQGRIEARRALREEQGVSTATRVRQDVESKCEAFAKDHPDFKTVVTDNPVLRENQLSVDAGAMVTQSEYTADILYMFGQDTPLAIRVAKMTPAQQGAEIGRMIDKIVASKSKGKTVTTAKTTATPQAGAKPVATKSITKAPPPPAATRAAGRATARDPLDPSTSMDEFARQHRAAKESGRSANRKMRGLSD
jgi:hypothetical protein